MEPLSIVISAMLKAASTEVVKRGLDDLSEGFKAAFERKNREEIAKIAIQEGITQKLSEIAEVTLDTSVLVQVSAPVARPSQRVDFFSQMLELGFKMSKQNNMDILVPGSFIDDKHMSIFSVPNKIPSLKRSDGVNLRIGDMNSIIESGFYGILPVPPGVVVTTAISEYKRKAIKWRSNSESTSVLRPGKVRRLGLMLLKGCKLAQFTFYLLLASLNFLN